MTMTHTIQCYGCDREDEQVLVYPETPSVPAGWTFDPDNGYECPACSEKDTVLYGSGTLAGFRQQAIQPMPETRTETPQDTRPLSEQVCTEPAHKFSDSCGMMGSLVVASCQALKYADGKCSGSYRHVKKDGDDGD